MDELAVLVAQYGLEAMLESTHLVVALLAPDGSLTAWNSSLGRLKETRPGTMMTHLLTAESQSLFQQLIQSAFRERRPTRGHLDLCSRAGDEACRYDCRLIPLPDGRALFFAEPLALEQDLLEKYKQLSDDFEKTALDLKKTKHALDIKRRELDAVVVQAKEVAHTDPLTYLPNRRQIIGDLQREVLRSDRYHTPLSISMLDIDHFKKINDTYGHIMGDEVLRGLADQLREGIRHPDTIGRYGGEEFLIVLPNTPLEAADDQAARLCEQVRATTMNIRGQMIRLTVSIGIAQYRIGVETWQQLLSRADMALYEAKNQGRDRWAVSET